MDNSFRKINPWEFITPSEAMRFSDDEIKAFVTNYFNQFQFLLNEASNKDGENLLFALVEVITVNINDLVGVGDTFIYSNKSKTEVDQILGNYYQLLEDIKTRNENFITEFSNWYSFTPYILVLENSDKSVLDNVADVYYKWRSVPQSTKSEIINPSGKSIDHNGIVAYLDRYASNVVPILGLNDYPNAIIIIKPVSLMDPLQRVKPVGNFFIHLALKQAVSAAQIANFIHLFTLTWLKKHWNILFEKNEPILGKAKNEFDKSYYEFKIHKRNGSALPKSFINIYRDKTINDLLILFFKDDCNKGNAFQKHVADAIVPEIAEGLFIIKAKIKKDIAKFENHLNKTSRASFQNGYNYDTVKNLIITHLIIKACILIFDYHFAQVISLYRHTNKFCASYHEYNEKFDTATEDELKYYIQRDRLIYLGHHKPNHSDGKYPRMEINQNLIKTLSNWEVDVLSSMHAKISHLKSTADDAADRNILTNALINLEKIAKNS